jgi:hypothetical protein
VSIGQRECDEASDTPLEFSVRRARQILVGQKRYKKHWHTITPWVLGGVLETLDAETARADAEHIEVRARGEMISDLTVNLRAAEARAEAAEERVRLTCVSDPLSTEIRCLVVEAGGGEIRVVVARDTESYPIEGMRVILCDPVELRRRLDQAERRLDAAEAVCEETDSWLDVSPEIDALLAVWRATRGDAT